MKRLVKRLGGVVVCWGLLTCTASAEEFFGTPQASAVVNNPVGALATAEGATNLLQPALEELYDFRSGEWHTGTSFALYNLVSHQVPVASLRGGYAYDVQMPYAEAQANLPGITQAFILPRLPSVVTNTLTIGGLDALWSAIGKYGHAGVWMGYALDKGHPAVLDHGGLELGVALGGRLTF